MPFGILLFILIRVFFLIDSMRHAPADHQEEKQDETRAVLLKINEIMPQNHLDHDRGDLTDERRLEMFLRGQLRHHRDRREENIRRIGDRPRKDHMLHATILIELLKHMPLLDETSRFLPEEDTPDMKTQLDSQDFPQPGDHQSRNQAKKSSVHCKKGDRRDPKDITENQKPNTHRKGSIAKRGDIIT